MSRDSPTPDLSGLPGIDSRWSRVVHSPDAEGVTRRWHVLDNGPDLQGPVRGTLLCVHGNPTWSYLWRRFLAQAPPGWRVVAPDHLGMGWSERIEPSEGSATPRTLSQRIDDLSHLTESLGITGPVVTLAHDWGGPISLGWALRHTGQLQGVVLTNTAVHQASTSPAPSLIRLARSPAVLRRACVDTPAFVRSATAVSWPPLPKAVRDAFASPYGTGDRRRAVADFVADIPLEADHPSAPTLEAIAEGLGALADVPVLMLWGPRDPVFSDRYLRDLLVRLPHAQVHRYEGASHLVTEDRPEAARTVWRWVADLPAPTPTPTPDAPTEHRLRDTPTPTEHRLRDTPTPTEHGLRDELGTAEVLGTAGTTEAVSGRPRATSGSTEAVSGREGPPIWHALLDRAADDGDALAVAEVGDPGRLISFADLAARVQDLARGLVASGVRPGDRVAVLVPPGVDLTTAVYAVWRAGGVIVVADAGLGLRRLGRALRGAGPDHVIGVPRALAAARALRIPGRRILVGAVPGPARTSLGVEHTLENLVARGQVAAAGPTPDGWSSGGAQPAQQATLPAAPHPDTDCAVLFTSGATGPPKGVVYQHRQVQAQLAVLRKAFEMGPGERFVAAFAPFALYGPALGLTSAVPDMDVTAPQTLTATALADAVLAVDATLVFASPAALRNVVATAGELTTTQRTALAAPRLVMSAGAPVPVSLLAEVKSLLPGAATHTPYGMTEVLPVTDVDPTALTDTDGHEGVCVGQPVDGVELAVSPLDRAGSAEGALTGSSDVLGEICVRATHVKHRYDRLWATQRESARNPGWHRTGDVGHLDPPGRLWVEGRISHVVTTADGPIAPVGVEQRVQDLPGVSAAAVAGVGPDGTQQVVVIVVPEEAPRRRGPVVAAPELAAAVRRVAGVPVAAVLVRRALPVDIRHASKVDRTALATWADRVLHGQRSRRVGTGGGPT